MELCPDCIKDSGVFDRKKACCRERHYKMTLRVSKDGAMKELDGIRIRYGMDEFERLADLQPPPSKPHPPRGGHKAKPTKAATTASLF